MPFYIAILGVQIYSAYLGHFQSYNIAWYDRSWGHLFASFDAFLNFNWPAVVVTDARTGKGHIVTRLSNIQSFVRMIRTRFGETMPMANENMTAVIPYEHGQRQLRHISDVNMYKKLHNTLPAAVLAALRSRVKHGNPKEILRLWQRKDMTFLALDFEWSEKSFVTLEMGYAAIRSAHLEASGVWPPIPESNYRKGHYIVSDYVDKVHNRIAPTFPWDYAWGESQLVNKAKLPEILQALITSLASPDSESIANTLVLVTHTPAGVLERLQELKVKLPSNVLVVDVATMERQLFQSRPQTPAPPVMRLPNQTLPLPMLLTSRNIPFLCPFNNSGNDAFYTLLAFQHLLEPETTRLPPPRVKQRDGYPMVAPQPMPQNGSLGMPGMMNGSLRTLNANGAATRRLSVGIDELGAAQQATLQARMSMMNGSMPSFFPPGQMPQNGGSSSGSNQGTGPRGRPPNLGLNKSDMEVDTRRRSGSMPRSIKQSGPSSPRLPPDQQRSSSRPKMINPNSGSSHGHGGTTSSRRPGHNRTDSGDDFTPPQAPFARDPFERSNSLPGRRGRNSGSFSSMDDFGSQRRNSNAPGRPSPVPSPTTPNGMPQSPSITVTDHNGLRSSGDRSSGSSREVAARNMNRSAPAISLNENKDQRPQSEVITSRASAKEKGGFLSSTFKRLSMRP
ncbi:hypothetical protein FRC00_006833 [Tulasnella sp. 408]|nr:hypothetical protein FRC00_006833 [Tulasnella sp. 408]